MYIIAISIYISIQLDMCTMPTPFRLPGCMYLSMYVGRLMGIQPIKQGEGEKQRARGLADRKKRTYTQTNIHTYIHTDLGRR